MRVAYESIMTQQNRLLQVDQAKAQGLADSGLRVEI